MTSKLFSVKLSTGLFIVLLSLLLISTNTALSQTAVVPPGEGTQASPYLISELGHLVWMSNTAADSAGKYYTMTADIDASATATWNDAGTDTSILEGFKPIGTYSNPDTTSFLGIFDGNEHKITGLVINRLAMNCIGLFGQIGPGSAVQNVGLIGGTVRGNDGHDVIGIGGLIGYNLFGTVSNTYAIGMVTEGYRAGGLVGRNFGPVSNSYATGEVRGYSNVGGLIGINYGPVSNSYATGVVTGVSSVGGLVGRHAILVDTSHCISNSYATGTVMGDNYVGGLVGYNYSAISNTYATGAVTGNTFVGGLVGVNSVNPLGGNGGTVLNAYATGAVTGDNYVGGLIGGNSGTVSQAYWDIETSGKTTGAGVGDLTGVTGKTSAEMKQQATFVDWDFPDIWIINENISYPRLRSLLINGDANDDGLVDVGDLGILAANYGQSGKSWFQGDFNNDDLVDVGDLGILAANYGYGVANTASDFSADYAQAFCQTVPQDTSNDEVSDTSDTACSALGLPLIFVLAMMDLIWAKLEAE